MLDSASRMPGPLDGARGRTPLAHHRPQRRRLAGAVAPDETDQLARRRLQRNLSEDVAGLDEDVDVMHAQHGYWSGVREVAVRPGCVRPCVVASPKRALTT